MDNSNNIENYNVDSLKAPYPSTSQVDLASEDFTLSQGQSVEDIKEEKVGQIRSMWDNVHKFFTTDSRRSTLLVGLVLAGCVPQNVTKDDTPIKTETPIINPKPMEGSSLEGGISSTPDKDGFYTVQPTPVIPTPTEIPTPIPTPTEIPKKFDESVLNIAEWENLEVKDVKDYEPGERIVKTTKTGKLFLTPVYELHIKDPICNPSINELTLPEGLDLQIAREMTLFDPTEPEKSVKLGILGNTFTDYPIPGGSTGVVISATDRNGTEDIFIEEVDNSLGDKSTVFFLGQGLDINGSKGVLLSLRNLLDYQLENGPFKSDQEYSFSEVIKFFPTDSNSEFRKYVYNAYPGIKTNVVVCNIGSLFERLVTDANDYAVEVSPNPSKKMSPYEGPFVKESEDFEVILNKSGVEDQVGADLVLKFKKDTYVGVTLIPIQWDTIFSTKETGMLFSLYLTDSKQESTLEYIKEVLTAYEDFEKDGTSTLYQEYLSDLIITPIFNEKEEKDSKIEDIIYKISIMKERP